LNKESYAIPNSNHSITGNHAQDMAKWFNERYHPRYTSGKHH